MKFVNKNIGFDFDKTLQRADIQRLAGSLGRRNTIWIVTRRFPDENEDVYEVAGRLGIPKDRVIFTAGKWKWTKLKELKLDYFYDDKVDEINMINKMTDTKGILV